MKSFLMSMVLSLFIVSGPSALAKDGNNKYVPKHVPKNVIILISDGCGYNQTDAAGLYQYGRTGAQVYEHFPVQLGMSTYSTGSYDPACAWSSFGYVMNDATDSAAAATAMSTGYKTYDAAIGVDPVGKPLLHLMEKAEQMGKVTGVVTSVEWSHATPAGFVAHNVSRNNYEEIAQEMIISSAVDVIMGCGHPWFDHDGLEKSQPNTYKYVGGESTWDALIWGTAGGDADGDGITDPWTLIQSREDFQKLADGETPKRVVGVARVYQTLQQSRSGDGTADPYDVRLIATVPTLEEMTKAALNVLDDDPDGFVLMVEGGAVDWAGHANQSGRVIEEEIDFNRSVEAALNWVEKNSNWSEALVIVTGDHETGYLTGPGSGGESGAEPIWYDLENNGAGVAPGMEWHSDGHTNSLIPFFAKGRGAQLFKDRAVNVDPVRSAYLDNTDIAQVIFKLFE